MFRYGMKRIGGRMPMASTQQGGGTGITDPNTPAKLPAPIISDMFPKIIIRLLGGTITIKGDNFQAGAKVLVGSTELTTTYLDSMMVTAALQPSLLSLGTYSITVLNPDGQSDTEPGYLVLSLL